MSAAVDTGTKGIVAVGFGNGTIRMGDYGHFDEEIGSIASNDLLPQKVRILLRLAL